MWQQYPDMYQKLKTVEEIIGKNLQSRNKELEALLQGLSSAGGKRLRPAFTILSAGFGKKVDTRLFDVAAGIEILHMATLVHDDIIDEADIRRGKPTVNRQYGDKMAVYVGDFLLSRAVMMLSDALPTERLAQIAKGIKSICEAEVEQFYSRFNPDISLVTYLKRIGRKTSALFSFSCGEGAYLGGCTQKQQRKLVKFGFYYGMAFQIKDDILNLTEDAEKTGKPKGNDIQEGVITLPLILSFRKNTDFAQKARMILQSNSVKTEDVAWMIDEITRLGGIDAAWVWMERYMEKARKMLELLPNRAEKKILIQLLAKLSE